MISKENSLPQCQIDDGHHQQIPVVGFTLLQLIGGRVDQSGRYVLVDEEEQGECKTKRQGH